MAVSVAQVARANALPGEPQSKYEIKWCVHPALGNSPLPDSPTAHPKHTGNVEFEMAAYKILNSASKELLSRMWKSHR